MFVKGGTIIFRQKKRRKKSTLLLCQIPAVAGEFIPSPTRDLISYLVLYIFAFTLMTKNNNLKMWFHIETWHNAQLLKFYRNSLLLFPRAWSKFTRNPRARQLHFFFFYLFQLLLQLHCPLGYGTTDRVLDPLHIGVHVVQSQHLAPARDPVHCLLRHVFRYVTSTPVPADIWNIEEDGGEWRDTRGCSCTRADKVLSAVTSMSGTVVSVELARSLSLQLLWAPTDDSGSRCWYPTRPPPRLLLVVGWIISSWFQRANWRLCVLSKKLYLGSPLRAAVWREKALFGKKRFKKGKLSELAY